MSTHAAVVLAAGGSRRLGRPKQLLRRQGETLLHRAVRLAALTQPQRLLLVVGAGREAMIEAIADLDAEIELNPDWSTGLAGSLRCAAAALHAHAGAVLLLGCDQPALEASHLSQLLTGADGSGHAATMHGNNLGTPAVIPVAALQTARTLQGDIGLRAYLTSLPDTAVWRLHAPELQLDIDTADDVQLAISRGWLDTTP